MEGRQGRHVPSGGSLSVNFFDRDNDRGSGKGDMGEEGSEGESTPLTAFSENVGEGSRTWSTDCTTLTTRN